MHDDISVLHTRAHPNDLLSAPKGSLSGRRRRALTKIRRPLGTFRRYHLGRLLCHFLYCPIDVISRRNDILHSTAVVHLLQPLYKVVQCDVWLVQLQNCRVCTRDVVSVPGPRSTRRHTRGIHARGWVSRCTAEKKTFLTQKEEL